MIFDCFPFFNEFSVLEIRLHELAPIVDRFLIVESAETYGGKPKPYHLTDALTRGWFAEFVDKITIKHLPKLEPACTDRVTGRLREAFQRNMLMPYIEHYATDDDFVIFSDCDEIPRAEAVRSFVSCTEDSNMGNPGIHRFKMNSYYYTVNRLVDYGHDWAARARIGTWKDVKECGTLYNFRMFEKNTCPGIENGGWHFGYFGGGLQVIKDKVDSMSPFLNEYKLFGDKQLLQDIVNGKDLHHRRCELPETFAFRPSDDPTLPKYYLEHRDSFSHFTEEHYRKAYKDLLNA